MAAATTGIDHLLIGVADLEAARVAYERLGFTVCPRGRHIGWGTANYCIMFADDYLELLGIVDAGQFTNNLDRFLDSHGEGLLGLALATGDAASTHATLTAAGIAAAAPKPLKRLLELHEGTVEPRFSLVHLPDGATAGLSAFVVEHLTPDLIRRPEWLVHPNGATRIAGLTVALPDPAAALAVYGRWMGQAEADRLRLGAATLELVEGEPGLRSATIAVTDLAATRRRLSENAVETERRDGLLAVAPEAACGVDLRFVSD